MMLPYVRVAGTSASTSLESTTSRFVLVCVSTTGVAPETVIVSSTAPTRRSALIVVTPAPVSTTPSRLTVENPDSVKVTVYVPGLRSTIRYWPVPSVTTVRDFSMSAGLDASTLTPGRIAPDVSRTMPATAGWENEGVAKRSSAAMTRDPVATARMDGLLSDCGSVVVRQSLRQGTEAIKHADMGGQAYGIFERARRLVIV